jgi:hypothetical protein
MRRGLWYDLGHPRRGCDRILGSRTMGTANPVPATHVIAGIAGLPELRAL